MSQKAERVQAFYEGGIASGSLDELALNLLHPEVEILPALGGELDFGRHYRGRDGVRELLERISEGVEGMEITVEPKEVIEIGDDRLLRVERWHLRGWQGLQSEIELFHIYTFRDGLIVGIDGFRDKGEALQAAGIAGDQGGESDRSGGSG